MAARKSKKADDQAGATAPVVPVPAAPLAAVPEAAPPATPFPFPPTEETPKPAPKKAEGRAIQGQRYDTPKQEITFLRQRIATDEARIRQLERPFVEFPKMVTRAGETKTFATREAQDAAGPEWADAEK